MKVRLLAVWLVASVFLPAQSEKYIGSVRISPDRGPCGSANQAGPSERPAAK